MSDWSQFEKECFLLVKDQNEYLRDDSFQTRLGNLIVELPKKDWAEAFSFVEKMITRDEIFYEMEKKYLPILVYKGEQVCHDILNFFADCMIEALRELGQEVEIFDARIQPLEDLFALSRKKYKAVFGVQTYLFFLKTNTGEKLHDYFQAPLFNMIFDHPVTLHNYWMDSPKNLTVLTHDRNYQKIIEEYYSDKLKSIILPPGGVYVGEEEKIYDLTFVGSYHSWNEWVKPLREIHKKYPYYARKLLCYMKKHPNLTYEACFDYAFAGYSFADQNERLITLVECKEIYFAIMHFYRRAVIYAILETGLVIHVYGDTWYNHDFEVFLNRNLIVHDEISIEQSLQVYAQSKMTLNIMSWHKDGMTERIANGMLGKAVVISDETTYLKEHFIEGKEIILFRLDEMKTFQRELVILASDSKKQRKIAYAGFLRANKEHLWKERAKAFLNVIYTMNED